MQFFLWGPDNGDERGACKDKEEAEVEDCGFLFLLLGDSSLRADRSFTFEDLLVFGFGWLVGWGRNDSWYRGHGGWGLEG